jgi:prevent-host-death family protein
MEKVSAFEAKTHLSKLLRETEKGKSFLICRRGKEVAQLLPPTDPVGKNGFQSIAAAFRHLRENIPGKINIRKLVEEGRRY